MIGAHETKPERTSRVKASKTEIMRERDNGTERKRKQKGEREKRGREEIDRKDDSMRSRWFQAGLKPSTTHTN